MSIQDAHDSDIGSDLKRLAARTAKLLLTIPFDMVILAALVAGLNLHLLGVGWGTSKIFLPQAVAGGEWWRLFTHPFVHVSWYHLLLDASAFFLLYAQLRVRPALHRLVCLVASAGVSLGAAIWVSPSIDNYGLAGLSGTAHGLMAFCGLEMMERRATFRIGVAYVLLLVAKSICEAITGEALFAFVHLGNLGTPQVVCHLGGVVGGLFAYALLAVTLYRTGCTSTGRKIPQSRLSKKSSTAR